MLDQNQVECLEGAAIGTLNWAKREAMMGNQVFRKSENTTDLVYYVTPTVVPLGNLRGECKVVFDREPNADDKEISISGHFDKRVGSKAIIGYQFTEEDKTAMDWVSSSAKLLKP